MHTTRLYRTVAREVAKASLPPRTQRNREIMANIRRLFEGPSGAELRHDAANLVTLMRSQRAYKTLLARYNPLVELTGEERVEATARRVGLNMPHTV